MKIRRYTCKDMQDAMLKVKLDLGSEAMIISSRKVKPKGFFGFLKKPMLEVLAAVDDDRSNQKRETPQKQNVQPKMQYQPQTQSEPQPFAQPAYQIAQTYAQNQNQEKVHTPPEAPNDAKINELEDKVKTMELMLEKVYRAVSKKDSIDTELETVAESDANPKAKIKADSVTESVPEDQEFKEGLINYVNNAEAIVPTENNISYIRNLLFDRDVEPKLIEKILEKLRDRGGNSLKKEELISLSSKVMTLLLGEPEPITISETKKPHVVIFLGPTGVGKTTTLAKIAADFIFQNKKVGLITADTYRIAAVEQLKTYAEILNLQVTVVYSPNEINDAVERLKDNDLILIDTAGRSHKNKAHFDELKALVSAVNADETFLVVSSNTSRIALREILEYYAFIKDYKLLFTKLDESPVCGIILNARYLTGKPLSYTTNGQSVPDDMNVANVKQIVDDIIKERNPHS